MSTSVFDPADRTGVMHGWLPATVSACLNIAPHDIEPEVPLTRYGLDSLGVVEISSAIAARTGRDVPASLLHDYPSLASLERFVSAADAPAPRADAGLVAMRSDAELPSDIRPATHRPVQRPRTVLVTGATGFLGAHLVHALLSETGVRVCCMVRASSGGMDALRRTLRAYALWQAAFEERVETVTGDLSDPEFGLAPAALDALAQRVDAIYHCAAEVNWVLPYESLRAVNVLGTRELLRLACAGRAKAFHFVSSAAVCYSTVGPSVVAEARDMLPYLAGLHFGYAQSKCVAEALVRAAAGRGLRTTIHRPSLIAGSAATGLSNADDLVSRIVKGCVEMGCAPDLDWPLDLCPVDFAARAIVRLSIDSPGPAGVTHLANPNLRHWRDLVLWMNLFGYPLRLIPYRDWLDRLRVEGLRPGHALHALTPFFTACTPDGLTLPELYEQSRRARLSDDETRVALRRHDVACPALDSRLLERYFRAFIARGFLPPVEPADGRRPAAIDAAFFEPLLRRHFVDDTLAVLSAVPISEGSQHSILAELASARAGSVAVLTRWRVTLDRDGVPETLDLMVKAKARDTDVLGAGETLARACDPALGPTLARFRDRTGLVGSHLRELAIYAQRETRFVRHTPHLYGAVRDDARRTWLLVLEHLSAPRPVAPRQAPRGGQGNLGAARRFLESAVEMIDSADDTSGWRSEHVEAALAGIAATHAIWYRRERDLAREPWLGPVMSAQRMEESKALWSALSAYSQRFFRSWVGTAVERIQRRLIADLHTWWRELEEMPRTLIHNDFNPRNLAFRRSPAGISLCAYDWELATLGLPQRDCAELLCFVVGPQCSPDQIAHYLDHHRTALERSASCSIDRALWQRGFQLALADLIVNRLPMYTLAHTFRRQAFLERVVRTWLRLWRLFAQTMP